MPVRLLLGVGKLSFISSGLHFVQSMLVVVLLVYNPKQVKSQVCNGKLHH